MGNNQPYGWETKIKHIWLIVEIRKCLTGSEYKIKHALCISYYIPYTK
jgi:hypothetical protein